MPAVQRLVAFLLYSNIFIALCAFCFTLETYLLLQQPMKVNAVTLHVFFATLFIYLFHRFVSIAQIENGSERVKWVRIHILPLRVLAVTAFAGAVVMLFFLKIESIWLISVMGIVSVAYAVPLLELPKKVVKLREMGISKIFIIALVWAGATVLLPVLEGGAGLSGEVVFLFIERYLFIFAITIPFDIRDLKPDEKLEIKTIPSIMGVEKSKKLAYLLLMLFVIVCAAHYLLLESRFLIFAALFLSAAATVFVVSKANTKRSDLFYSGLLDGMMILQFLLVWMMYLISDAISL